jgi:hypothetical protein
MNRLKKIPKDNSLLTIILVIWIIGVVFLRIYGSKSALPLFIVICGVFLFSLTMFRKTGLITNRSFNYYLIFFIYCSSSFFYALSNEYVMEVWMPMLANVLFMLGVINYCRSLDDIVKFCKIFLFCIFILSIINLSNFTVNRREFMLGGVNSVAVLMVVGIFICIFLNMNKLISFRKLSIYHVYLFSYLIIIILSGSRKILLAIGAAILIYGLFQIKSKKFFKSIISLVVIIGAVYALGYYLMASSFFATSIERFLLATEAGTEGNVEDVSGSEFRLYLIKKGLEYWSDSPIVGHGLNNYRVLSYKDTGLHTYSHNTGVELLSGLGVIGFVLYLIFYLSIFAFLFKARKVIPVDVFSFLVATVLSFLVIGYFQQTYWDVNIHIYFILVIIYIIILKKNRA